MVGDLYVVALIPAATQTGSRAWSSFSVQAFRYLNYARAQLFKPLYATSTTGYKYEDCMDYSHVRCVIKSRRKIAGKCIRKFKVQYFISISHVRVCVSLSFSLSLFP